MGMLLLCSGVKSYAKIADTTYQIATNTFRGQQNAQILKVKLNISDMVPNSTVTISHFYFSTKGTTNVADITAARLFYTGRADKTGGQMNLSDTIGATIISPGGKMVFSSNKPLITGDNYFFLTYNVSPNANLAPDAVDATLDSIQVLNQVIVIKNGNPTGFRLIDYIENYCNISVLVPNTVSKQYIGITNVQIGSQINNTTADLDRLTFYPNKTISVYREENYPVRVKYGQGHNEQIIGWVDWNNDGIIDTNTETVFYVKSSPSAETFSTNLYVPCTATPGSHKLRIESDIDTVPKLTPCSNLRFGDAEEYIINVLPDVYPSKLTFVSDSPKFQGSPVVFVNKTIAHGNVKCEWCFSSGCLNNNNASWDAIGDSASYTWTQSPGKGSATHKVKMRLTWRGCDSTVVKYYTDSVKLIPPS